MFASQAKLDTIAHNISNANTPGYSRQDVDLATEGGLYTGAGFYGRGVKIVTVTRQTNEFLIKELNVNIAAAAGDQTRLDKLKQLESVLPTGENGLGYAASQVLNAFVDVATQPQDLSARQVALSRAEEWVSRMNTAGNQINAMQEGVLSDLKTSVETINSLTKLIASVNQDVAKYTGSGHTPNDLLDKRDQLVRDLNQQVQVSTVEADDGTLSVFMGGGQLLVLSNRSETLEMVRDPTDPSKGRVALSGTNSSRILDSGQMTGGALRGLIQFQDNDLTQTRSQLNTFANNFAEAFNAQQALGVDLDGNPKTGFDASGNPVAESMFLNTQDAAGIRLSMMSPKGIAAASPLVAVAATTNRGTATVDSLVMKRALPNGTALDAATSRPINGAPLNVVFEADPSDPSGQQLIYRFMDENGNPYKDVSPPRAWSGNAKITDEDSSSTPATPLFELSISGVPKAGDRISIQATQFYSGNNGNAMAMLDLRDKAIVSLDGTSFTTVTDAYSQMIGSLGVIVQSGETSADISQSLQSRSEQTLSSASGVNLDEEAARLIQFQQSYQAAAKVLQIAQSIFDTLLQTARG
jgi:flagellar hook-associated protein 1 FlgK